MLSLRDESPARPRALHPQIFNHNNNLTLFPKDQSAGGTWVGTNNNGTIIILLNGGFVCHERREAYAKSRGLIVTELLTESNPVNAWSSLDLSNIEPHTLVIWHHQQLYHLTWDGTTSHVMEKDSNQSHIWSSSTLYNLSATQNRKQWFEQWMTKSNDFTAQSLLDFFRASGDTHNGFVINRNEVVKTLSMTLITANNSETSFLYHDFATDEISTQVLKNLVD